MITFKQNYEFLQVKSMKNVHIFMPQQSVIWGHIVFAFLFVHLSSVAKDIRQ